MTGSVAEYGGRLQRIGLGALQNMAELESDRERLRDTMNQLDAKAKGESTGQLVGIGVGALKGGVQKYLANEFEADVRNVEAARSQFPDEASYQASIRKNYSPAVLREVGLRRLLPAELKDSTEAGADPWRAFIEGTRHFDGFVDR